MPKGYNTIGDILTKTVDGRDLNDLWGEFQQVVAIHNERRQTIINLLTFPVTNLIEDVPQITSDDFEEASEFGVPKSTRVALSAFQMAYTFKWYDIAKRFTWQFLAEAPAAQLEAIHQQVLEADNRLVFRKVMNTMFRNTNRSADINGQNYTVFAFYNADGTVPPAYGPNEFDGTYTHYLVSGAATLDSGDVELMISKFKKLGYSRATGVTIAILVNSAEAAVIRTWRANVTNANTAVAQYDFIPAVTQPAQILPTPQGLIGTQPPSTFQGLPVVGSYGDALIVEEDYIPAGYLAAFCTGGDASLQNPIGIREHANSQLRGLRLLPGDNTAYPLTNSNYVRGFGTGVRQRGAGMIMQIKASGSYEIPPSYAE